MIAIVITLDKNTIIEPNYYLPTQIHLPMRLKLKTYRDFWNDKDRFDNSDYAENSQYLIKTNKKIIGKFKHEADGIPIIEFIGLRSKMYFYT